MMLDAKGRCKSDDKFACEVTVSVIDLMDPGDLVFTVRNVERRRRVWKSLRAKESAFEIAQAALFSCDAQEHFTNVNKAFLDMFSLDSEEEAKGMLFSELMPDAPLPENFAKALAGETTTVGIVAQSEDGEDDEEVEVVLAPNRDGRKIKGVAGSVIKV